MAGEASRRVSYDEAADLLGLPAEAVKRLALRRSWPHRPGPTGATLVAMPEAIPGEIGDDSEEAEVGRGGVRSLLSYLEAQVDRLTEELAEVRNEMRGVRYEAESARVEAGRVQVFAALVEAERAWSAEIRTERDRLADELAECRRFWIARLLGPLLGRRAPGMIVRPIKEYLQLSSADAWRRWCSKYTCSRARQPQRVRLSTASKARMHLIRPCAAGSRWSCRWWCGRAPGDGQLDRSDRCT